jgi:hypothetical protein
VNASASKVEISVETVGARRGDRMAPPGLTIAAKRENVSIMCGHKCSVNRNFSTAGIARKLETLAAVVLAGAWSCTTTSDARRANSDGAASSTGGQVATGGAGGAGNAGGAGAGGAAAAGTSGSAPAVLPPAGQTWLLIGQDVQTIDDYAAVVAPPGGLVGYTSLQTLGGLDRSENNGAGVNFMQSLVTQYPRVPVAIGLYLVGALGSVNAGSMDGAIAALGAKLGALGRPVLLRIGYEFDNPANGYDPTAYRAAFARVASRVRPYVPAGLATVWQSSAICGLPSGAFASYYPGDDAVDWMGVSYFSQASCAYAPVQAIVAFARSKGKPVLIAESAPQGYDLAHGTYSTDGASFSNVTAARIWTAWFAPLLSFVSTNADVIRGVSYIDADWNAQPMWSAPYSNGYFGDSRVQADPTILANWRAALADPRWATE